MSTEAENKRVIEALQKVGIQVTNVYDLVNTRKPYTAAIPILVGVLSEIDDDGIKEGIVRALTIKEARGIAAKPLIKEFERISDQDPAQRQLLKWAIGNALSVVADESVFEKLVGLLKDKKHGKAREMLAVALGNMKDPRAADILIEMLNDEELAGHSLIALGKLKAKKAIPYIQHFLNHQKPWICVEAKRALSKIDAA